MLLEKTVKLSDVKPEVPTWIHPNELLANPSVSFSDGYLDDGLMDHKYEECDETFIDSLVKDGQKTPVLIEQGKAGYYVMNGHHRLAVAARHNLSVLVLVVPIADTDKNIWDYWDSSESNDYPDCGYR